LEVNELPRTLKLFFGEEQKNMSGTPQNPFGNPYSSPTGPGQPMAPRPMGPKTSGVAIAAVICGPTAILLSICCGGFALPVSIAAIVCGAIGLNQTSKGQYTGKGMALTGVICGVLSILLAIANIILGIYLRQQGILQDPFGR
jgi:hypothetical protein